MRVLLTGVLGGIGMFVWTSIAHMVLPLGKAGITEIPNESALLSSMQSSFSYWNWYGFPGIYTASYVLTQIISFLVVGIVAGLMLRSRDVAQNPFTFHRR